MFPLWKTKTAKRLEALEREIRHTITLQSWMLGKTDLMNEKLDEMEKKVADAVAHADSVATSAKAAIDFLRSEVEKLKDALSHVDPNATAELVALKDEVAGVAERVSAKMDELDADMAKVGASGGV